jgi:hypothetical protein
VYLSPFSRFFLIVCIAAPLISLLNAAAAEAGKKRVGGFLGGIGVGIMLNEMAKGLSGEEKQKSAPRPKSDGGGGNNGDREASRKQEEKSQEASINYYEEAEAQQRILQNEAAERNRNVKKAIDRFIEVLAAQHSSLRGEQTNVRAGNSINQVTAGEVRSEVESAYLEARLTEFDRFAGELWTRDRLTVQILREAEREVEPYFEGVGAKGPSMEDLKTVFSKAAAKVYARAIELAEIVGVSHSFDRFIRTIYENSDRAPESLWTIGADGRYERLLSRSINAIDRNFFITDGPVATNDPLGLERLFQFRFRARRALYDCLSAHYASMAVDRSNPMMGTLPTLIVEGAMPGDTQNRGISLEPAAGSAIASPMTQAQQPAASSSPESSEQVWTNVTQHVRGACNTPMMQIANAARQEGLQPVPARWDVGSVSQQMDGLNPSPQFMPINSAQPR